MYVVFVAIAMVTITPSETFKFVKEFKTLTECKQYIYKDKPKDRPDMMGCIAIAKLEKGKKWEDNSVDLFNTF